MHEVDLHQEIDIKKVKEICPTAKGEHCEICGTWVPGFEYKGCCSGRECGCMGKPIEPCICSQECYETMFLSHEPEEVLSPDEEIIRDLEAKLKKYKDFHESVTCFFAEGVEFMNKVEMYDAFKKEWQKCLHI